MHEAWAGEGRTDATVATAMSVSASRVVTPSFAAEHDSRHKIEGTFGYDPARHEPG